MVNTRNVPLGEKNPMKISTLAVLKIRPGALLGKMSK